MRENASIKQRAPLFTPESYSLVRKIYLYIEDCANRYFTPHYNPFYYLGAISTILFTLQFNQLPVGDLAAFQSFAFDFHSLSSHFPFCSR